MCVCGGGGGHWTGRCLFWRGGGASPGALVTCGAGHRVHGLQPHGRRSHCAVAAHVVQQFANLKVPPVPPGPRTALHALAPPPPPTATAWHSAKLSGTGQSYPTNSADEAADDYGYYKASKPCEFWLRVSVANLFPAVSVLPNRYSPNARFPMSLSPTLREHLRQRHLQRRLQVVSMCSCSACV